VESSGDRPTVNEAVGGFSVFLASRISHSICASQVSSYVLRLVGIVFIPTYINIFLSVAKMGKTSRYLRKQWSQNNLEAALEAVRAGESQRNASARFEIPRRTLRRYIPMAFLQNVWVVLAC
jgi:hypothetical protein